MSAIEQKLSADAYHAHPAIGRSMLETFRKSRRKYHALYVAKTMQPNDPSDDMLLGTAFHAACLEPTRFLQRYAVPPKCDKRTVLGKAEWSVFCADNEGKTFIDQQSHSLILAMRKAVEGNAWADRLLGDDRAQIEDPIFWTDRDTGLRCKSLRDCVTPKAIVDLKTCRDPSTAGFARAAANSGYVEQAAWYVDGHEQVTGERLPFVFIAVGKEAPHVVCVYEIDPDDMQFAHERNRESLRQLAECHASDDWRDPEEKQITKLAMPGWYRGIDRWNLTEN